MPEHTKNLFQILSPNMLKTFANCPKKFYFKYIKNINMPVNDDIFEAGKNIHALASYYLNKQNIDLMEKSLSAKESAIWSYLKNSKYFSYNVINTEYTLSVKIGNHFFEGRLDALVQDKDRYYILDYKTGGVPKDAKYDFQTIIYMLSVKEFFKTDNVTFVYIDLKNKDEVCIELTPELIKKYKERIENISQKIENSDFTKKNTECKCEYSIICY